MGGFIFAGTWALYATADGAWADPRLADTYAPTSSTENDTCTFKFWGTRVAACLGYGHADAAEIKVDGVVLANNAVSAALTDSWHTVVIKVLSGGYRVSVSHLLIERNVDVDPPYPSGLVASEQSAKRFPLG